MNPLNIFVQTVFVEFCFLMFNHYRFFGLTKDLACLGKDSAREFMVHTYYWLIHIGKAPLVKLDLPLVFVVNKPSSVVLSLSTYPAVASQQIFSTHLVFV